MVEMHIPESSWRGKNQVSVIAQPFSLIPPNDTSELHVMLLGDGELRLNYANKSTEWVIRPSGSVRGKSWAIPYSGIPTEQLGEVTIRGFGPFGVRTGLEQLVYLLNFNMDYNSPLGIQLFMRTLDPRHPIMYVNGSSQRTIIIQKWDLLSKKTQDSLRANYDLQPKD